MVRTRGGGYCGGSRNDGGGKQMIDEGTPSEEEEEETEDSDNDTEDIPEARIVLKTPPRSAPSSPIMSSRSQSPRRLSISSCSSSSSSIKSGVIESYFKPTPRFTGSAWDELARHKKEAEERGSRGEYTVKLNVDRPRGKKRKQGIDEVIINIVKEVIHEYEELSNSVSTSRNELLQLKSDDYLSEKMFKHTGSPIKVEKFKRPLTAHYFRAIRQRENALKAIPEKRLYQISKRSMVHLYYRYSESMIFSGSSADKLYHYSHCVSSSDLLGEWTNFKRLLLAIMFFLMLTVRRPRNLFPAVGIAVTGKTSVGMTSI